MKQRELVVVLRPDSQDIKRFVAEAPAETPEGRNLADLLHNFGARMQPMFDFMAAPGMHIAAEDERVGDLAADMANFYSVDVDDRNADHLLEELLQSDMVETAYFKPAAELPIAPMRTVQERRTSGFPIIATLGSPRKTTSMFPSANIAAVPVQIPDFRARQEYLDAAPAGIDAMAAWAMPGGKGRGVRIIDIEGDWRFSHADLRGNGGGLVGGTSFNDVGWRDHGTAVLGQICGGDNGFGITGIVPDAVVSAVSHGGLGSAKAIQHAANLLGRGDVLLLEMHRPGPRFNYQSRLDQRGFIAIEWWPDDLLAIQYASARGVIVVEAAGNGAENLDDALYDRPAPGFPRTWRNPFRGAVDSTAIVVGAGAPPPGTHGRDHGPDRSRLDFSNFGSRVDCQGWGREVTTTGYGDLFGKALGEDYWFTDTFSGTSSASPIVTGVVAALQGICREQNKRLDPRQARILLRNHGSAQQDAPGRPATQRIGLRPDLQSLVGALPALW